MRQYRTFFWPAVLVLVGVVALLVNTGTISTDRLGALLDLWPLVLIVAGLEIIVRSTLRGVVAEVAALLVVVLAVAGVLAYLVAGPTIPNYATNQSLDSSGSAGGLTNVSLEVDAGAATITVTGDSSLGPDLYRAHIDYSGEKPVVALDRSGGTLRISQSNSGFNLFRSYRFNMRLTLNPSVAWSVTENTGAASETLDLTSIKLDGMTINTGASREDITLGPPPGQIPITLNGGALTVHVHRPSGTEASIAVSGGMVSLDADGHQQHTVGNASYQTSGYSGATASYQLSLNGGACTVTLDTTS